MGRSRRALLFAFCVLALLSAAAWNGFPLIYTDTGTYLKSALTLEVPVDRPIFYGLFLRATQLLGPGLWRMAAAQACVVAAALIWLARKLRPSARSWEIAGLVSLCAVATPLPWVCGQLIPDAFTGVLAVATYALLFWGPSLTRAETAALGAALVFSIVAHSSHAPIVGVVLVAYWARPALRKNLPRPALGLATALALVPVTNRLLAGEWFFSKATPVFLMNRLVDSRLADRLLAEHCDGRNYAFCAYRDVLRSLSGEGYLWSEVPLNVVGGWESSGSVTWPMIIDAAVYYPFADAASIADNFARQLLSADAGKELCRLEAVHTAFDVIRDKFPDAFPAFARSRQQTGALEGTLARLAWLHRLAALAALALGAWLLSGRRKATPAASFVEFMLIFCAANAFVCGLNEVSDRFQARAVWLFVFAVAAACLEAAFPAGGAQGAGAAAWGAWDGRAAARLAAALAAAGVLGWGALCLISSRYTTTEPTPYFPVPVVTWPRPERIAQKIKLATFSSTAGLAPGARVQTHTQSGREFIGTITAVSPTEATMQTTWEWVRWSPRAPKAGRRIRLPLKALPRLAGLRLGVALRLTLADGRTLSGTVVEIGATELTLELPAP